MAQKRRTKSKTPKRSSTRKRERSAKQIYYDGDHTLDEEWMGTVMEQPVSSRKENLDSESHTECGKKIDTINTSVNETTPDLLNVVNIKVNKFVKQKTIHQEETIPDGGRV